MLKIAVLVSGRGSNLQAIIDAIESGNINGKIEVVISNKNDAYALERARKHNIEGVFIEPLSYKSKEDYDRAIIKILEDKNIELVCLAGFMRILTPYFVNKYRGRIMNIHPSLLPAFPGLEVQKKALDYGVKFTGATVHFVDDGVDSGPIIIQSVVPVLDIDTSETLSERILKEEHRIYPEAIKLFAEGRISVKGRRAFIKHN
ncbi:MAG: phosphoribosylglycinamide formyltransferase [Nitrospinae bacterium RIFCSPLOWO2_12_39_16]|nr:MAG: phosphoribosylglycinamide formyltransferase [Nitrospinae bacterium RIFCSPLOWO2_12_39_16]HBA26955.1 phosphoribosylglycinamide formyltransferase [Nitrospinota bacterium]